MNKIITIYRKVTNTSVYQSLLLAFTQGGVALFFLAIDFFYSKELSQADFGIWRRLLFVINMFIPILSFGIAEGYKYYLAKEGKKQEMFANTIILYAFISVTFLVIIGVVNIFGYLQWINLNEYYLVSLLFPVAYFAFVINKALRYAYINEKAILKHTSITIYSFLITTLILGGVYCYFQNLKSYYLLIGILLYICLYFIPLFPLIKSGNYIITSKWINKDFIIKVLKQGIPLYLATFIGLLTLNIDTLIINFFEDDKSFAIFSVGALEIPIFAMISAAFSQHVYPDLVKMVSSGEKQNAKNLWIRTTKKVSYITYPMLILLMFFAEEIIFFIYSSEYAESVFLFQTYLLVGLFRNNYYGALITASGQTKYITKYAVLMLLLNVMVSIPLYFFIGVSGVVFGTLIATVVVAFVQLQHEKLLKKYFFEFLLNPKVAVLVFIVILTYLFV